MGFRWKEGGKFWNTAAAVRVTGKCHLQIELLEKMIHPGREERSQS